MREMPTGVEPHVVEQWLLGELRELAEETGIEVELPEVGAAETADTINAAMRAIGDARCVTDLEYPVRGEPLSLWGPKIERNITRLWLEGI